MKTVDIDLGARSYQIRIGQNLLSTADEIMPWIAGEQICVVTDEVVAPLYLDTLQSTLANKQVILHVLPTGEAGKTMAGVESIFECLLRVPCDRSVTIVALGGGVVGDMAGFAAACYQRGVPFIQIPTTLLAQVDSSVGGKTGVNHALGKNMIGAFYQPCRVLTDITTLGTLDTRQFAAGMAEVIKYGIINDLEFFVWIERNIEAVMARNLEALAFIIERSCLNKARIIESDERENGIRAVLNLGHTFGHAIEAGTGYNQWLHGEAVATGIAMATHMALHMKRLSTKQYERIIHLLHAAKLPTDACVGLSADKMLELMKVDKKVRAGNLRLILPHGIGNAEVVADYPAKILLQTLSQFASGVLSA